ncbi:MAG: hypothetical protein JRN35_10000 [Nitrososphaerota archaeon]|nr:hypothetical protein [Nitrososphaerota archaeon]
MPRNADSSGIFHAYDVRGVWGKEINPVVAQRLGASVLAKSELPVLVGRDTRAASQQLQEHFLRGLRTQGHPIVDLGILPTPAMGFAARSLGRYGFVLSPSHNPVGYVGVKGFSRKGVPYSREWRVVSQRFQKTSFRPSSRPVSQIPMTKNTSWDWEAAYVSNLTKDRKSGLRVVLDARGGAMASVGPRALRTLGAEVVELHTGYSPTFFGCSPEPTPENIHPLEQRVVAEGADIGITFDGDGDRVLFVDERGRRLDPEMVACFLHQGLSGPGQPLVATVDASYRCEEFTKVVRSKVGGRFVTQSLARRGGNVGFEVSSHFYLTDLAPDSDGLLTACVLLSLLADANYRPSQLRKTFGEIFRSTAVFPFANTKLAIENYRRIRDRWDEKTEPSPDGIYLLLGPVRALLRPSNTQPILRLSVEASSKRELEHYVQKFQEALLRLRRAPGYRAPKVQCSYP